MLTILVLLFLLIVFDLAAMRWGFPSNDGLESKEWERRKQYACPEERQEARPIKRPGIPAVISRLVSRSGKEHPPFAAYNM